DVGEVVRLGRLLHLHVELVDLAEDALGLGLLRRDRGVGNGRYCGQKSRSKSQKNVRRLSPFSNTNPLGGGLTGAPGGAGASRRGTVAGSTDARKFYVFETRRKLDKSAFHAHSVLRTCGTVPRHLWLGRHPTSAA